MRGLAITAVLSFVIACAGEDVSLDAGSIDAAAMDAASERPPIAAPDRPLAPVPPAPPMLLPCPSGWRELAPLAAGDPVTCEPWPESGEAICDPASAHFPGEPSCTPVGTPCPAGEWPEDLPANVRIHHVKLGATPGGDGSADRPWTSIGGAFDHALPTSIIAIARGRYDETLSISGDHLTLWGACPAETILTSSRPHDANGVITTRNSADIRITNLAIEAPVRRAIAIVGTANSTRVDRVIIRAGHENAIAAYDGALELESIAIYDAPLAAVFATDGANVTVRRAIFADNRYAGAWAWNAHVLVEDTAIAGTTDPEASGVIAQAGGSLELRRSVLERNTFRHVFATDPGSAIDVADAVLRDLRPGPDPEVAGVAVVSAEGASLVISRATITAALDSGIHHDGRTATVSDTVVRGAIDAIYAFQPIHGERLLLVDSEGGINTTTAAASFTDVRARDLRPARARAAFGIGGRLHLERARIERADYGVFLTEEAAAELFDLALEDVGKPDNKGFGIVMGIGSTATVARATFHHLSGSAIAVSDAAAVLRDVEITGTRASTAAAGAAEYPPSGLFIANAAHVRAERVAIRDGYGIGTWVIGASLDAVDLHLERLQVSRTNDGRGIEASRGAIVRVERGLLSANETLGVLAADPGTDVVLAGVAIERTSEERCRRGCEGVAIGVGAVSANGGHLELDGFELHANGLCGLLMDPLSTADLANGAIAMNPIGINVLADGYELSRLIDHEVLFSDNGDDLASRALMIPEATPPPPPGGTP